MGSPENDADEPLTPAGRLFLRPELNTIIHCVVGLKNPIDINSIKSTIKDSIMVKHPRFCSLMVRDHRGVEHWKKTQVDIDRHFIVGHTPIEIGTCNCHGSMEIDSTAAVNEYVADLSVSTPLSSDKPLWEIHVLVAHNCAIIRVHHALGDGISLISMLLACCRRADDADSLPTIGPAKSKNRKEGNRRDWAEVLWGFLRMVWFSLIFVAEFVMRSLWVRDRKTAITGGAGVELWPRKMATARFLVADMKAVKNAVANATINDVVFGVISSGLSRYLDHRSPNGLQEGLRITGVAMVNLREQSGLQDLPDLMRSNSRSRWGNKFGMFILPVYCHNDGTDHLQHLKRAKMMLNRKKQSLEAHVSYKIGDFVMSWLGPKFASLLNYRILCNTTFTFSNVIGPQEEITFGGNPITYIRASTSSLPHALTIHLVSYAGRADMQLLVAKDIIPDPEFLAKCFEDALLEMKEAAAATTKI